MEVKIKKFFSDVNISSDLYDEMLRIAPSSIKWLSKADLSRTGIGQDDPYYAEAMAAQKSRELNISKQEYERRIYMINTLCTKYDAEDKSTECIRQIDKYGHE